MASEAFPMFFANGISDPLLGLLVTHSPFTDRKRVIDPGRDDQFNNIAPDLQAQNHEFDSKRFVSTPFCTLITDALHHQDSVSGMTVDAKTALHAEYKGQTIYFCRPACRTTFLESPE
jgi:YHS domain-containing protein